MLIHLLFFELNCHIRLNLRAVVFIQVFEVVFQGSKLEEFPFLVKLGPLHLLHLLLLGSQFLRQHLLLVVQDLEVLLGAQELVVVLGGLVLSREHLALLRLDDLLQLYLLVHYQFHVLLEPSELGLETGDGGSAGVLLAVLLESFSLELLHLGVNLFTLLGQSAIFEAYLCLFLVHLLKLVLKLLDSGLVMAYLASHATLV